ncbi:DUF6768 family protein [Ekhidna sp.]|uniref:DUF6768 family protein n=1 Tax=Ekhidna sp. TaxID=2608089 RepID=UPI0032ECD205
MKKNDEIDQMIKEALSEDEKELFNTYDEQSMFQMLGGLFQGKMKWLNAGILIIQFVFFGLAVYCGYRLLSTSDVAEMIPYGVGVMFLLMAIGMLKLFQFMEMHKNATIREIKRLELQVSVLAKSLKKG